MKDIEMHKFLGVISRDLAWLQDMVKGEDLQKEIYEVRRKILKQMIKIEKQIWKEERKKHAKII